VHARSRASPPVAAGPRFRGVSGFPVRLRPGDGCGLPSKDDDGAAGRRR
jgi:hypothetical protein